MSNKVWFYLKEEKKEGPFSDEEIIKLIKMEIITENDDIWMTKMNDWMKLKDTIYSFYIQKKGV